MLAILPAPKPLLILTTATPAAQIGGMAAQTQVIALDLDLDYVRRVRRRGWHGIAQTLKSFRDGPRSFPPYEAGARSPYLDDLGALEKPQAEAPTEGAGSISTRTATDEAAE